MDRTRIVAFRRTRVILLCATLTASVSSVGQPQASSPAALDSIIQHAVAAQHIPGIVAYVSRADRVLLSKAYGLADVRRHQATTLETPFPIASISKTFTASLVYALADRGRLSVDQPIGVYLNDLPPWKDSITVKQLLTHTSGLPEFWDMPGAEETRGTERSARDLIRLFESKPLWDRPGTHFRYSLSSWIVLGALIEHVTQTPYADALQQYIIAPLKLTSTAYCGTTKYPAANATGFRWDDRGDSLITGDMRGVIGTYTAGGVCASAIDVAHFASALLSGRLIERASLTNMLTPPALTRKSGNGAGIFLGDYAGHAFFSHSGSLKAGFQSELAVFPADSLTVVLVANQYDANLQAIRFEIVSAVLGLAPKVLDLPLSKDSMNAYAGRYPTDGTNRLIFFERDGRLHGAGGILLYQGDHTFVPSGQPETRVVFTMSNGKAIAMELYRDGMLLLAGERALAP